MTDFASVGVKMETEPVARGIKTLEQLAATGPKVERSMSGVEQAATKANKSLKGLGDGADKGLNAVGTAAPRAEQSLGRVAKNADEAKRSIAEMNRSASGLNAALRGDHLVRGFSGIETGATAAASAVSHLNYMLALTGAGISINSLIGWSDGYTKLTAQLRNATDSAQDYAYAMEQVKRISEGAQAGIGELGVLYARIASSTKELGISQAQVAKITETVALSLKANGASAAEASSAMLQLSQAFGSGVLRGEEFNAVYEAAPNLLRNLADAMGVPQGKLREMASDGKLTAEVLAKYLPESLEKVRKEAERMATIGGAFTVLNNKIMEFVGEANQASGAAKAISGGIVGLANNLDTVATAAGVVALVMAGRYTASMATAAAASVAAATAAVQHQIAMARTAAAIGGYSATTTAGLVAMTGAARAASLAMGALGGPVGLAVTAIGLGAAAFYSFGDSADVAKEKVASLLDPLDELTAKLSALPAEKRVAVTLDLKEEQQRAVEAADAAVDALIQSVGDLTNMRLPAGEWNELRDRVEGAAKSGQDLTPILTAAANSASLPEQHLNKWLQLAGNLRVVQKEAAEAANKLAAITGAAGAGGGRGSVNPKTTVEAAAERWVSQQFLAQRNNGITKQFAADIEGLAKAYANGALSATEYARAVTEANKKRYESTEAGKAEAKAAKDGAKGSKEGESAILSYIKSLDARTAAQRLEIAQGDKLTESQRARIQLEALLADSKNKASKSQVANAQALLAESEANEAWLKNASDVEKALADMQKAREQSLQSVQDSVKKLVEEAEAAAYAETHNVSLAEAVERLALARAENAYQQAVERQEAPATLAALEAELQARKKIVELTAQKGVKEANDKAQEQLKRDWERTAQTIGDTLADYIMGGGKDAAQYLKRLFATLVLQPVVQYGVQNLLGAVGMGGGSAGGSNALGVLNNASSLNSAYSLFGGGMSAANSVGTGIANLTGTGIDGLLATNGAYGTAGGVQGAAGSAFSSAMSYAGYAAAIAYGMKLSASAYDEGYRGNTKHLLSSGVPVGISIATDVTKAIGGIFGMSEKTANIITGGSLWAKGLDKLGFKAKTSHTGAGAIYENGKLTEGAGIYNGAGVGIGQAKEYNASAQASVSGVAQSIGSTLESVAAAFGKDLSFRVSTAFADDTSKDGAWGSLKIADALGNVLVDWERTRTSKWAPKVFSDGEAGYQEYLNAVQTDVLTAIQAMNLPGWAKDMFAAAEGAEGLQTAMQGVGVVLSQFESIGKSVPMFAELSGDMQTAMLNSAGGMDALTGYVSSFNQGFFSEAERMQLLTGQVRDALAGLNIEIDPAMGDKAKAEFKAAVQAAADAGNGELVVQLLGINQAFAATADYAQGLAGAVDELGMSLSDVMRGLLEDRRSLEAELLRAQGDTAGYKAALRAIAIDGYTAAEIAAWDYNAALQAQIDALDSAKDAAWQNVQAAVNREKTYWQDIATASQSAISTLSSTLNLLKSNADALYGTVDTAQQWQAAQGMVYIENALAAAQGGAGIGRFDGLSDAISAARNGISSGNYATAFDRERDALVLAGQLSELGQLTDAQLTVEERQLRAAQSQIDQLDKTLAYWQQQIDGTSALIDATLSVPAAISALAAALAASATPKSNASSGGTFGHVAGYADYSAGFQQTVADYGAKHGSDAYYFIPGVNDVASKLESYQDIADALGWTLGQAAQHVSGHGLDYWNAVDAASKAGAVVNASDSLEEVLRKAGVPGYAVGANYIPNRQLALLHEGEAVIPKAFNPWAGGTGLGGSTGNTERLERLVEGLTAEVQRLQSIVDEGNRANAQLLDITDQKSEGGNADRVRITNVKELAVAIKEVMA